MSKPQAFQNIAENLSLLDDWEDRYRYLIELGQSVAKLDAAEKTPENQVNGCVSRVWLLAQKDENHETQLNFRGESDAMIVQGLMAILLALYSHRTAREIAETDAIALFDELGLRENLTTQRSNGLIAMVGRIRSEAQALS